MSKQIVWPFSLQNWTKNKHITYLYPWIEKQERPLLLKKYNSDTNIEKKYQNNHVLGSI